MVLDYWLFAFSAMRSAPLQVPQQQPFFFFAVLEVGGGAEVLGLVIVFVRLPPVAPAAWLAPAFGYAIIDDCVGIAYC